MASVFKFSKVKQHPKCLYDSIQICKSIWYFCTKMLGVFDRVFVKLLQFNSVKTLFESERDHSTMKVLPKAIQWGSCCMCFYVATVTQCASPSELNFHIWNAISQSFARAKSEAKMAAHGSQFWTSVSVFYADLNVSSSPLHDFSY